MDVQQTLEQAEQELAAARRNVIQFEQLVSLLKNISGVSSEPSRQSKTTAVGSLKIFPKPKAAVLQVMRDNAPRPLTPKEIYTLIETRGDANPGISATAYATALGRMAKDEEVPVVQLADSRYVYREIQSFLPQTAEGGQREDDDS